MAELLSAGVLAREFADRDDRLSHLAKIGDRDESIIGQLRFHRKSSQTAWTACAARLARCRAGQRPPLCVNWAGLCMGHYPTLDHRQAPTFELIL